jgi:hypothetical protein
MTTPNTISHLLAIKHQYRTGLEANGQSLWEKYMIEVATLLGAEQVTVELAPDEDSYDMLRLQVTIGDALVDFDDDSIDPRLAAFKENFEEVTHEFALDLYGDDYCQAFTVTRLPDNTYRIEHVQYDFAETESD